MRSKFAQFVGFGSRCCTSYASVCATCRNSIFRNKNSEIFWGGA